MAWMISCVSSSISATGAISFPAQQAQAAALDLLQRPEGAFGFIPLPRIDGKDVPRRSDIASIHFHNWLAGLVANEPCQHKAKTEQHE